MEMVNCDSESAPISEKLKALIAIAGKVQRSGKLVTPEHVALGMPALPISKSTIRF